MKVGGKMRILNVVFGRNQVRQLFETIHAYKQEACSKKKRKGHDGHEATFCYATTKKKRKKKATLCYNKHP